MSIFKAFIYTVLAMLLWILIMSIIILSYKYFFDSLDDPIHLFGISKLTASLVAFFIVYFYFWKPKFDIRDSIIRSNYRSKICLYLPLVAIGLFLISKPFWDLQKMLVFYQSDLELGSLGYGKGIERSLYDYFSIMLIAPVVEELFFRKFLLGKLLEKNRVRIALLISSLCFSIIHLETINNIIPAFISGIILGFIYLKTKRLGYSIMLHFLFNLIIILTEYIGFSYTNWLVGYTFDLSYWVLFVIGIFATGFGVQKITRINNLA